MAEQISSESSRMPGTGMGLEDSVAVVSGGGTYPDADNISNGAASAILYAEHGASVVIVDRDLERARLTCDRIKAFGGEAVTLEADVTSLDECAAIIQMTTEEFGRVDVLHNNVGGDPMDNVVDADADTWQRSMEINLLSVANLCRHAIPEMSENGGGSIVNTSSTQARRPGFDYLPYVVMKRAVVGITRGMAMDHAQDGIRINCVMPGPIWTPHIAQTRDEVDRRLRSKSVPLQTEGKPWDVGWAAVFLASKRAKWITGVTVPVDGGLLLTRAGDRQGIF